MLSVGFALPKRFILISYVKNKFPKAKKAQHPPKDTKPTLTTFSNTKTVDLISVGFIVTAYVKCRICNT